MFTIIGPITILFHYLLNSISITFLNQAMYIYSINSASITL